MDATLLSPLPGCLIVTGMPGAGKTTVTTHVASRFLRSARLDGDVMADLIVNGRVSVVGEPRDESQRQLLLRAENLCSLAGNFAAAGFLPIIDHVVPNRAVLDLMIKNLAPLPVMFVVLAPSLEVCRRRNATRPAEHQVHYDFSDLADEMRRELGGRRLVARQLHVDAGRDGSGDHRGGAGAIEGRLSRVMFP